MEVGLQSRPLPCVRGQGLRVWEGVLVFCTLQTSLPRCYFSADLHSSLRDGFDGQLFNIISSPPFLELVPPPQSFHIQAPPSPSLLIREPLPGHLDNRNNI